MNEARQFQPQEAKNTEPQNFEAQNISSEGEGETEESVVTDGGRESTLERDEEEIKFQGSTEP